MIGKIILHEVRQRFFHWTTLLFFAMLIFQGIWYTKGNFDFYVNEGLLMNAAAIFYKNLAGGGMLMIIIVAIITGTALNKDLQYKTGQWVYTLPIHEKQFFLGRFLSAYAFNVIIAFGFVIGMLLVPYSGIGPEHRFGPTPIGQLLHGFAFLTMPNLFLLTSMFFFALVFTRKMAAGYLTILLTVVVFLVMQTTSESSGITTTLSLLDPFGYVATDGMILSLPTAERNTAYIPFSGNLFINRLVWLGFAVFLFLLTYFRFSFKRFLGDEKKKKNVKTTRQKQFTVSNVFNQKVGRPKLSFKTPDFLKKLLSLAILEFKNVVRPTSFRVILGIVLLMAILQNMFWNASYYIGPTVPLTSTMTFFRLSFGVFIMILLMVWAGELFFKDRTVKIHHITDTLPVPVWVTQLSRFFAMAAVSFVVAASFMVLGILAQIIKGGTALIELDLYIYDILGYNWGWLTYVLWIGLVFFISGLTGNRFLTHILCVGFFFGTILAFELGLAEQTRFAFAAVPGLEDYSEINGYGIWSISALWYFFMWTLLTLSFVLLGILFWSRGTGTVWWKKLGKRGHQLGWTGKLVALLALVGFFVLQSFIVKNVNDKGNFTPSAIEELESAEYEKNFGHLKTVVQPKIVHVDLKFDFHPNQRKASYQADMLLVNQSTTPIDSLFFNFEEHVSVEHLWFDGEALLPAIKNSEHRLYGYRLPHQLLPSDSLKLAVKAVKTYTGFTQSGEQSQPDLMFTGSFGHIRQFLPVLGYDSDRELLENRKREEHGLKKLTSRKAEVGNSMGLKEDFYAPDAQKVTGTITIGTEKGQMPIAPGRLLKSWEENDRSYQSFNITEPQPFNWYLASGSYQKNSSKAGEVQTHFLTSPKHQFNIPIYQKALHSTLSYIKAHMNAYPFKEVRVIEIPYYQEDFYAYPNTIAISEKEGWYADTTQLAEKSYLFHSLAAQTMRHWVASRINMANVQGVEMLSEALPEALAFQVLENEMGTKALNHILKKKKDYYDKERNNESNTEPPLLYADGADYLEPSKGAIALHQMRTAIGKERFMKILLEWTSHNPEEPKCFIDLYETLMQAVPKSEVEAIRKVFER
ncbi:MAG: hypothetical protein AAF554_07285 [Bacteroidota bacterium]